MKNWTGKNVVILGAARQGLALARYLAIHGAKVTLNDRRGPQDLEKARQSLAEFDNIAWALGGHPLEVLDGTDVLAISGGIPLDNPLVVEAICRGLPLTNDTQIFMEVVPCKTLGITGSAGKTTTATLTGRIAKAGAGGLYNNIWIGGNIGNPLINEVDEMSPFDLVILELSSFQLEQMTLSPNIAAILNITPNHLDRHGTMEAYAAAKARILDFQLVSDVAVLGRDDAGAWNLASKVNGNLLSFGFSPLPESGDGAFERGGAFFIRKAGDETLIPVADVIQLRGHHNRLNVMAASTIAFSAGFSPEAIRAGVEGFGGVAHRLEFVRELRGAKWYNGSIASAPERTIADIHAFEGPLVVMLGGRDKDLPWEKLAALVHERVEHVVLFGEAAGKIGVALGAVKPGATLKSITRCAGLKDAVLAAANVAGPGSSVLLSPGGTSFDEFKDFEERGENFRKWVLELS